MLVTRAYNNNLSNIKTKSPSVHPKALRVKERKREKGERKKRQKVNDNLSVCILNILLEVNILPSLVAISLVKLRYDFIKLAHDQNEIM